MKTIMSVIAAAICLGSEARVYAQGPSEHRFDSTLLQKTNAFIRPLTANPEPAGWYTGDIHVHRNCGDATDVLPYDKLSSLMDSNDLSVISVLADMGNGEVKDSKADLPRVTGKDIEGSTSKRIMHWDVEWHWDATYSNFSNQALGGHLVILGLQHANQIWDESPYKVLEWAAEQHAVRGFAHMEYLMDTVQNELNCCIPIDYPVEAALGTIDFVSEDVYGVGSPNNGNYNSEAAIHAYYKLLNCGIHIGLAAGTDYPCNDKEPVGKLLTYVKVKDGLTYSKWVQGIKKGNTVVSRKGHQEFISMQVKGKYGPGDEIRLNNNGKLPVDISWTSRALQTGRIEIVWNGKVVDSLAGTSAPGKALIMKSSLNVNESGWLCARRMDDSGHVTHTAATYVIVKNKPIRASAEDADFFVSWIDNVLRNTAAGGKWSKFFTHDQESVRSRYQKARDQFSKISAEAGANRAAGTR